MSASTAEENKAVRATGPASTSDSARAWVRRRGHPPGPDRNQWSQSCQYLYKKRADLGKSKTAPQRWTRRRLCPRPKPRVRVGRLLSHLLFNMVNYLYKQNMQDRGASLGEDNHSSQARDRNLYKDKYQFKHQDKDVQDLPLQVCVLRPRPPLPRRHRCGRARGGGRTA